MQTTFIAGLLFFAVSLSALAASAPDVEKSFRFAADVSVPSIIVPTVVSLPLPADVSGSSVFGVYSETAGAFLPYEVSRQTSRSVPVRVTNPDGIRETELRALVDENHQTVVDFPLGAEGNAGEVTLLYTFDAPITSDSLQMSLSQYVVRPTAISIRAEIQEQMQTVVSSVRPTGNTVQFPSFTSRVWSITLSYSQPLRFTELSFKNSTVVGESAALRFLAKPEERYKLYYDPEVILAQETGERPNLSGTSDVVSGSIATRGANSLYEPADSDKDGIADLEDNCPRTGNPEQEDIDRNGRGDACDDFDRDGIENASDNCVETPNRNQADIDRDDIGDACDGEESRFTEKYPWIVWVGLALAGLVFAGLFYVAIRRRDEIAKEVGSEASEKQ